MAADAIASTFCGDNTPDRTTAAVAGSSATCFDVTNADRAAATDVPDTLANCSAAEWNPARCHVHASSTRRASNVFADAANRSTRSNAAHTSGASNTNTSSGSKAGDQRAQRLLDLAHIRDPHAAPLIRKHERIVAHG